MFLSLWCLNNTGIASHQSTVIWYSSSLTFSRDYYMVCFDFFLLWLLKSSVILYYHLIVLILAFQCTADLTWNNYINYNNYNYKCSINVFLQFRQLLMFLLVDRNMTCIELLWYILYMCLNILRIQNHLVMSESYCNSLSEYNYCIWNPSSLSFACDHYVSLQYWQVLIIYCDC